MPFLSSQNEDELKKQADSANPEQISGQSGVINSSSPGAATGKPASSGSFTNIQKYLDANTGNTEAMADKVNAGVVDSSQKALDASQAYQAKAPTATKQYNADEVASTFYNDPAKANKEQYSALKTTGGYSGPSDYSQVEGYNDYASAFGKADSNLKNTQTETGRQQLLNDTYKRDNYSKGANNLDQALVQRNDYSKNLLAGTQDKFKDLSTMLDKDTTAAGNQINQNTQTAQANKSLIPGAEKVAMDSLINPIQSRADQYNAGINGQIDDTQNDFADNSLSQNDLMKYGLNAGTSLYGLNLKDFLTENRTQAGLNNAATADERSKYAALNNLIDGVGGQIGAEAPSELSPIKFNKAGFDSSLATSKAKYDQSYANDRGVVNQSYMPQYSGSFSSMDPLAGMGDPTAKDIQTVIMPDIAAKRDAAAAELAAAPNNNAAYNRYNSYNDALTGLEKSLNDWQNAQGANSTITSSDVAGGRIKFR